MTPCPWLEPCLRIGDMVPAILKDQSLEWLDEDVDVYPEDGYKILYRENYEPEIVRYNCPAE